MLSNLFWFPWAQIGAAAPVAPDYFPMGGPLPGNPIEGLPPRRGRRRRREDIFDQEDELITVILDSL